MVNISLTVYTDGSKFPKFQHIGVGAYTVYNNKEYRLSQNLDQEMFKEWSSTEADVSNPTAELAASVSVLYELSKSSVPLNIEIVADYLGVKCWNDGTWKATKGYILMLLRLSRAYTEKIVAIGGDVTYRHIKGHVKGTTPDCVGNDNSDKMAKSTESINEFTLLIQTINNKN